MSSVNAAGRRGPGVVRAAVKISLGCVLLGGCSAGTEQFTSMEFGSGYEAAPPRSSTSASAAAIKTSQYQPVQQTASSQPKPQSGYQLASASPERSGGYLQVSRVDLPPASEQSSGSTGVKTADGYGPYGPAPITDGSYPGPRVFSPYDQPNGGYPPPPPPPSGGYNPPPPGYYGGGPSNYAPPRLPRRIRAATPMPTGSSRRTSKTAADTTARRREDMPITGKISETARPLTAGEWPGPRVQPSPTRHAEPPSGLLRARRFFPSPNGTA